METHALLLYQNVLSVISDEANFAYIIEALQAKKPDTPEVKSAVAASHDPPPVLACSIPTSSITSEDVQSVKELFPHLEISHIEVFMITTALLPLIIPLLEIDW